MTIFLNANVYPVNLSEKKKVLLLWEINDSWSILLVRRPFLSLQRATSQDQEDYGNLLISLLYTIANDVGQNFSNISFFLKLQSPDLYSRYNRKLLVTSDYSISHCRIAISNTCVNMNLNCLLREENTNVQFKPMPAQNLLKDWSV